MTQPTPPADLLDSLMRALEPTFRLDDLVALSPERALYRAWDRLLKRSVALRVHLVPGAPGRAWFLRESETLAALDHAAIRHVYAAWTAGDFAYRTAHSPGTNAPPPRRARPGGAGGPGARPASGPPAPARRPLLHRHRDAGGFRARRGRVPGAGRGTAGRRGRV